MATTKKKAASKRKASKKAATKKTKKAKKAKKSTAKAKGSKKAKTTAKSKSGSAPTISKAQFLKAAKLLQIQILTDGDRAADVDLDPREFSSGSFGWFASEKVTIPVGKDRVRCQMSINLTVIGSKNSR